MTKKQNKKGFTIVELVIVIAVIAVLAAVLIPTFSSLIKKARVSTDIQNAKNFNTVLAANDLNKPTTLCEVWKILRDNGYNPAPVPADLNSKYYWNKEINRIVLVEMVDDVKHIIYPENITSDNVSGINFVDFNTADQTLLHYFVRNGETCTCQHCNVSLESNEETEVKVISDNAELSETLNSWTTETSQPIVAVLPSGDITLPRSIKSFKEITITGNEDSVVKFDNNEVYVQGGESGEQPTINLVGVTVDFENADYSGLKHTNEVVYKNCTIKGKQFLYAEDIKFINCTFENEADYCLWTYGSKNVTFIDCTFNTGGKAVLVYNEATNSSFVNFVTFNNCTFNDSGALDTVKAAVETGSNANNTETSNKYNIYMNNCIVNGFDSNNSTSNFFGNKNSMDQNHLNVVIDGVDVY